MSNDGLEGVTGFSFLLGLYPEIKSVDLIKAIDLVIINLFSILNIDENIL